MKSLRLVVPHLLLSLVAASPWGGENVVQSTAKTFSADVMDQPGVALVAFYAPWCGHCKNLAPAFDKAAAALKGIAPLVAVDATAETSLGSKYGVKGFPTIKVFGFNKKKPTDYQGGRDAKAIVDGVLAATKELARTRLNGGKKPSGPKFSGGGSGGSAVHELTDDNFEELVLDSKDQWLVAFTAPWCGHCKNLLPEWDKASMELKGKVKLGNVDATAHQGLAGTYGVQGYPTIKWFAAGEKAGSSSAQDYQGERKSGGIVKFALDELAKSGWEPEVNEIFDQAGFKEQCEDNQLCILGFLPSIYDDGKDGREGNIAVLKSAVAKATGATFGAGWVEAGAQEALESKFRIGGFPSVVLISHKKKTASVFNGAFDKRKLTTFVQMLGSGKSSRRVKVKEWPKLNTVEKWDGGEAPVIEEEFSLEELMGDDL